MVLVLCLYSIVCIVTSEVFRFKLSPCLQFAFKQFRNKHFSMRTKKGQARERERGAKSSTNVGKRGQNVHVWRVQVKSLWMLILVFCQLFCRFEFFRIKTLRKIRQSFTQCFTCRKGSKPFYSAPANPCECALTTTHTHTHTYTHS